MISRGRKVRVAAAGACLAALLAPACFLTRPTVPEMAAPRPPASTE